MRPELLEFAGMRTTTHAVLAHPSGEQPSVEVYSATADTFAGRVHVEWDSTAPLTPLGQLPFFIDYLKQAGLFDAWVADCPLSLTSPNAPRKRDLLGTVMLSVLSGHRRYAHVTTLRCDPVNPPLLGMRKIVSEDAERRGLTKIDEAKGLQLAAKSSGLLHHPAAERTVGAGYGQHREDVVTGIRKAPKSVTIRPNLAGHPTLTIPTCYPACGWCCASTFCLATNTTSRTPPTDCGHCWIISVQHAVRRCYAATNPGASSVLCRARSKTIWRICSAYA